MHTEKGKVKHKLNKRTILIIAGSVLGAAALVVLSIFLYRTVINPGAAFTLPEPQPTQQQAEAGGTAAPTVQPDMDFMKGRVNILVMGMDSNEQRLGSAREDFRTDTMLLVTIDFNTGKVDMITTPRDSFVQVTKATGNLYKVNSAAFFGGGLCDSGFKNACDTISGVFGGLPVPYYVGVNMDGLTALVDAMGGVDYAMDIAFTGKSGRAYQEGLQHLDGAAVLDYLRVRKGYGTDVDRQERQRKIILAVFKQLADSGQIQNLPQIYQSLSDMVYTNLTFEQICALAVFGAGFDDWDNIGQYTLPGEYHTAYGVYFYLLDQQGKADLVKQIFGWEIGIDKEHDLHYVLRRSGGDKPKTTKSPEPDESTTAPPDPDESATAPPEPDVTAPPEPDKPAAPEPTDAPPPEESEEAPATAPPAEE